MADYTEPCCCFDASLYTGTPDTSPVEHPLDVPAIIKGLDELNNSGREAEAEAYLDQWLEKARSRKDWRAELTILSELLGQVRRSLKEEKGIRTVNEVLTLLHTHTLGSTISGATILLNAATTLKCFGRAGQSIPIFRHVARVYADHLDPGDYRSIWIPGIIVLLDCTTIWRFLLAMSGIFLQQRSTFSLLTQFWKSVPALKMTGPSHCAIWQSAMMHRSLKIRGSKTVWKKPGPA